MPPKIYLQLLLFLRVCNLALLNECPKLKLTRNRDQLASTLLPLKGEKDHRKEGNYTAKISRLLQISPLRNENLPNLLGIINKDTSTRQNAYHPGSPSACLRALKSLAPVQPTFATHLLITATTYLEIVPEREFQGVLLFITNKCTIGWSWNKISF